MAKAAKLFLANLLLIISMSTYPQLPSDSIRVGNMVVINAFKYQILAHQKATYDSAMIIEKVYEPTKLLWDGCLSQIFGDAGAIYKKERIAEWNDSLFDKQQNLRAKLNSFCAVNLDSLFGAHLRGLKDITGYEPKGRWILYAGPDESLSLVIGGCTSEAMAVDLAHSSISINALTNILPHEFEHMVFEQLKAKDSNWNTALGATLDEGLACYYSYIYGNGKISKQDAVEGMTEREFQWYLDHEKEIFEKSKPYLFVNSRVNTPYQCNCRSGGCKKLFDSPKTICYFLGFRIIESYERTNGKNSWKDIYKLPLKEFYNRSGYMK